MKKLAVAACVIASFCFPYGARAADRPPRPEGWVSDYARVIRDDQERALAALIDELERKTSAEVAVVAVESIAPYDERSYARLIFDDWKIGKKGKDNGVLLLLAVRERRWRIETGYGVEGILPDGLCGEIGRTAMVPYFKEGRYGEGLYRGAANVAAVIARDAGVSLDALKGAGSVSHAGRLTRGSKPPIVLYVLMPLFFFIWNLPWPVYIGLPVTLLFALAFSSASPIMPFLIIGAYIASRFVRYRYWRALPSRKRGSFFGAQTFGGRYSGGSGGWSGGFGGGGFGGGCGGGGGAGGGF